MTTEIITVTSGLAEGRQLCLLSAQLPAIHWVMICVIRSLALTVSDVCLKHGLFSEN